MVGENDRKSHTMHSRQSLEYRGVLSSRQDPVHLFPASESVDKIRTARDDLLQGIRF